VLETRDSRRVLVLVRLRFIARAIAPLSAGIRLEEVAVTQCAVVCPARGVDADHEVLGFVVSAEANHFRALRPVASSRIVLDPFSGSGTTGLAAQGTGRRYIGIDLHAEYLDLSLKTRLQAAALNFEEGTK